jgi:hypothetical protein
MGGPAASSFLPYGITFNLCHGYIFFSLMRRWWYGAHFHGKAKNVLDGVA